MIRRPPRSTLDRSSAASDVYKRQPFNHMIQLVNDDITLNPCLQIVNAANGSDGLEALTVDNSDYWEYIRIYKLAAKGLDQIKFRLGG